MKKLIEEFPQQLSESIAIGNAQPLQKKYSNISSIVICGMGGSGIGAQILAEWTESSLPIPLFVCQNYTIPAFVNSTTLVITSSYSGNTEETLAALTACEDRGAMIIGVSSGGELAARCTEKKYDLITVPGGLPPRAALAYSLVQLVKIVSELKLIPHTISEQLALIPSFLTAHQSEIMVIGAEIAELIDNTNAVIYAEAAYESAAVRGKQQFNENSKYLCRYHVIPEMNHNELVGWGCGTNDHSVLFLETEDALPTNKKRMALTKEIVSKRTNRVMSLTAKGSNHVERSMYFIHLLDWASYFLGTKRNEDIVEVNVIDYLKSELGKGN